MSKSHVHNPQHAAFVVHCSVSDATAILHTAETGGGSKNFLRHK